MRKVRKRVVIGAVAVLAAVAGAVYAIVPEKPTPDSVAVFSTSGMTCGSCAGKIDKALRSEQGVAEVEVDLDGGRVFASVNSREANPAVLAEKVTTLGYRSSVAALVPVEEFRRVAGRDVGQKVEQSRTGGCGCCNKSNKGE
jgi:periplasmic mercuric ion binding protein